MGPRKAKRAESMALTGSQEGQERSRALVGKQIEPGRTEKKGLGTGGHSKRGRHGEREETAEHWWKVRYGRTEKRRRKDRAFVGSQIRSNREECKGGQDTGGQANTVGQGREEGHGAERKEEWTLVAC